MGSKSLHHFLWSCDSRARTGSFSCLFTTSLSSHHTTCLGQGPPSLLFISTNEENKHRVRFHSSLYQRLLEEGAYSQVIAFSGNVLQTEDIQRGMFWLVDIILGFTSSLEFLFSLTFLIIGSFVSWYIHELWFLGLHHSKNWPCWGILALAVSSPVACKQQDI